ncbi:MAG: diguanylate cyclase, partial [Pseudomonadota bacterium]
GKTVLEVRGPEAYGRLKDKIEAALRGERMHFEHAALENGRKIHLLIDYIPDVAADGSVPGFYTMALDISERKNAELVQAASEKRLKLITDNVPVLISYIDTERRIQFGNATYERWFGVSPAQLVNRPILDVFGEDVYEVGAGHLDEAFAGKVVSYEAPAEGENSRVLEVTFVPDVQTDGSVAGVYALAQDMTRVKAVEEKLKQLARVDSLTGIANRRSFVETLAMAIDRSRRHGNLMALAYLDIDHFKKINDTYGHATGDDVLKEFSRRLVAIVRSTDTVARLSGDEFVIILDDIAEAHEVATIAAKIVEVVRLPFELSAARLNVTTSVGIALFANESQAELLAHADAALYQAKRDGRNRFAVHGG